MNRIPGIEIFAPGTHNGDIYTEQDLDDLIEAHKQLDYRPALKIGHTKDSPGAPAYGWVTNLRRVGKKLVADFESMHDSVVQALRDKRYDRVSSEIYFNLKRNGQTFRRALKAVALLGAEVPAVVGLTPLHKMEFGVCDAESVGIFETTLEGIDEMERENFRADLEVDRRALRRMLDTGNRDYDEALDYVLADDPQLARQYSEQQDANAVGTYARR